MWSGFSAAATAAMQRSGRVALKLEVWNAAGAFLADITYALTGGQVTEDETAAVRRTCQVTLDDPALVPATDTDLLHPLTGNELRPYRGVWVPGAATPELAPLGVFRLSEPESDDDGNSLTVTVAGNDRSSEVTAHPWTAPYTGVAGLTVPAAIEAILNLKWSGPPLTFNLYPSTVVVPPGTTLGVQFTSSGVQTESGSQGGNNDPWADCVTLALSAGCELFFDRTGTVVMRPVPQPNQQPALWSFAEGVDCTMISATRSFDQTAFRNGVILIGTGTTVTNSDGSTSPGTPVVASAYSTDPLLGVNGPLGSRPAFITDETVSTQAEAQVAANAQLPLVMSGLDATTFDAVDNPALDAGDPISLTRARLKLAAGNYIGRAVVHPLDATTAMQVTNRPFSVAA